MALGRQEEMIWREASALSGDLSQVADNLKRDAAERLKVAKALQEAKPGHPIMTMVFDITGLVKDLTFIQDRIRILQNYISIDKTRL